MDVRRAVVLRPKWIRDETLKRVLHRVLHRRMGPECSAAPAPAARRRRRRDLPRHALPPSHLIPGIPAIVVARALFTTAAPHHGIKGRPERGGALQTAWYSALSCFAIPSQPAGVIFLLLSVGRYLGRPIPFPTIICFIKVEPYLHSRVGGRRLGLRHPAMRIQFELGF